jgi:hypothetical protein
MNMEHRFSYPKVTELRSARPDVPRDATRSSQRALVAASLIRCPDRGKAGGTR